MVFHSNFIRGDYMLKVIDAKVENADESQRTYQLVLDFGSHQSNVRLFCKEENNKPKAMLVAVMEGVVLAVANPTVQVYLQEAKNYYLKYVNLINLVQKLQQVNL